MAIITYGYTYMNEDIYMVKENEEIKNRTVCHILM